MVQSRGRRISQIKDSSAKCEEDMAIFTSDCSRTDTAHGITSPAKHVYEPTRAISHQRRACTSPTRCGERQVPSRPRREVSGLSAKRRGNLSILATAAVIASTILASPLGASASSVPGAALLPSPRIAAVNPASPAQGAVLPNFVLDNTPQKSALAAANAVADSLGDDVDDDVDPAIVGTVPVGALQTAVGVPTPSVVLDNNGRPPPIAATIPATTAPQFLIPTSSLSAGYLGPAPSLIPQEQPAIENGQQPSVTQMIGNGIGGANAMPAASGQNRFRQPVNSTQVEAARQQAARTQRTTTIVAVAFGLSIFLVLVGILIVFFFYWRRNNDKKRVIPEKGRISPPIPFDGTNGFPSTVPPPKVGVQTVLPSVSSFGSPIKGTYGKGDANAKQNGY